MHSPRLWSTIARIAAFSVGAAGSFNAFGFNFSAGQLQGAFDTDLTYGISWRTQNPDDGPASPSDVGAYGNRTLFNDRWDIFSNVIKGSHTLELTGTDYGMLMRGNWFYDFEMDNQPLPSAAKNRGVSHGDLTDAYVYKSFGASGNVNVRAGKQVISWGESTFIQGSLSDINTVDISKLRTPGADLKDAFTGTPALDISWTFLDNYTLEAFYLFGFDEVKADPMGAFFTGLDFIADGGGFPNATDVGPFGPRPRCFSPDGLPCDILGGFLTRAPDDIPSGGGQWGTALRIFLPNFGNGGEVAFYYQNLHDHLPVFSGYVGSGKLFLDYPEDIERWGMSFNTQVLGLAVGGEYSWRRNAPVQLSLPLLASGPAAGPFAFYQAGLVPGSKIKGWDDVERHQLQFTVNKNWGVVHALKADSATTIAEVMWGWLGGLPSAVPLGGPLGVSPAGEPLTTLFEPAISQDYGKFVIRHGMGYNAALFNLVALEPTVAFSWDLHGYSNEVGGAKLVQEDRKALTLGLGFAYGGGQWTGSIGWTRFWGDNKVLNGAGSRINGSNDRDFMSANVSYSF